ncbi:hypothetical protein [Salinispora mooreana]|nr:hypothetical protein [Salinispora mooreana]
MTVPVTIVDITEPISLLADSQEATLTDSQEAWLTDATDQHSP